MAQDARKRPGGDERSELRRRMRAAGLRPARIWVPDTRSLGFAEECRRQSQAVAASDPAGDELMHFVAGVHDWPDA